jgi:hypothetical protein
MNKFKSLLLLFLLILNTSCGSGDGGSGGPTPVPEPPRFTDNGDGTVTDNYTTLMWIKDPKDLRIAGVDGLKSWVIALDLSYTNFQKNPSLAWHLPNIREMMSLMDYTEYGPALATDYPFLNIYKTTGSYYWTSTTDKNAVQNAWCIDLYDGKKISISKATGPGARMLLVRIPIAGENLVAATGQLSVYIHLESDPSACTSGSNCRQQDGYLQLGKAWPSPRFTDYGDTIMVEDNLTRLIWYKHPLGVAKTWSDSDSYCKTLIDGEWRLPTVTELETLLDASKYDPAITSSVVGFFTGYESVKYWTSSVYAGSSSYAWTVDFLDGSVTVESKATPLYVWPVRGPIIGG